jgi:predicted NAD/FAD-binding protein
MRQMRRHTPQFPAPSRGFASSDVRLKRDVKLLQTLANGIKLYRYQYRWGDTVYVGVMAHEVASIVPEAVSTDSDGYYRVDYQRLGLRLRTYQDWMSKGHAAPLRAR